MNLGVQDQLGQHSMAPPQKRKENRLRYWYTNSISVSKEYEYLLHSTSMEAKKSRDVLSISWRFQENQWCNSVSLKAQEPGATMSKGRRRYVSQVKMGRRTIILPLFCSIQVLME